MSEQSATASDNNSTNAGTFVLRCWQSLDRGWKAAVLGALIVLQHLVGVVT